MRPTCSFSLSCSAPLTLLTFAGLLLGAVGANAGITLHVDENVGGFVPDSASAEYLAAGGASPTQHLSFEEDRDGTSFISQAEPETDFDGQVDGQLLSYQMVLSSPGANGGALATAVQVTVSFATGDARVGPTPGFQGMFEIRFLPPYATAVGFGPVGFGSTDITIDTITVYDPDDQVLYSGEPLSKAAMPFTFVGFTTDMGDRIERVVLAGDELTSYAIQDLQFVPEPGALAQSLAAVATLCVLARRRRAGA